jgi:hypothetical protein
MAKLSSKQIETAHADIQKDARQRIADRGILQFRADSETVLAVLDAADKENLPVGALLRQWVQEKLMLETSTQKAPDLIKRVSFLEDAVTDLREKLQKQPT